MSEERVSGCIFARKDEFYLEGETYVIRNKYGNGWGIPVSNITPEDLRVLADRIESKRSNKKGVDPER